MYKYVCKSKKAFKRRLLWRILDLSETCTEIIQHFCLSKPTITTIYFQTSFVNTFKITCLKPPSPWIITGYEKFTFSYVPWRSLNPHLLNIFTPMKYLEYSTNCVFNRKSHHLNFLKVMGRQKVHLLFKVFSPSFSDIMILTGEGTLKVHPCNPNHKLKVNDEFKKWI